MSKSTEDEDKSWSSKLYDHAKEFVEATPEEHVK